MKTKEEAQSAATKLLKQMKTAGWKIRVWENRGWHYSLTNAFAVLRTSHDGKRYYVLLDDKTPPEGECGFWHVSDDCAFCSDPNKAVEAAVKEAACHVEKVAMVVETMEGILYPRWAARGKKKS